MANFTTLFPTDGFDDGGNHSAAFTAVANRIYTLLPITADTNMTLPTGTAGQVIHINNSSTFNPANPGTRLTGDARWQLVPASGQRIGRLPVDTVVELDNPYASFTLIYTNATVGWAVTAVN